MDCLIGFLILVALGTIFIVPLNILQHRDRERAWEVWEKAVRWPLKQRAYVVADIFIKLQQQLNMEATPKAFWDYIMQESGYVFPIDLCRVLLTEVALHGKHGATPLKS